MDTRSEQDGLGGRRGRGAAGRVGPRGRGLEIRGDYLQPGDLDGDGRRVGIHWETDYGRRGLCQNATGVDASLDGPVFHAYGQHQCNKNWKENHKIRFRVGTCNGSKVNCTYLKNWGQWSGWSRWYLNG